MMKELISSHEGIGLFGIISLLLFFVAFAIAAVKTWGMRDSYVKEMASLALDENNNELENKDK